MIFQVCDIATGSKPKTYLGFGILDHWKETEIPAKMHNLSPTIQGGWFGFREDFPFQLCLGDIFLTFKSRGFVEGTFFEINNFHMNVQNG